MLGNELGQDLLSNRWPLSSSLSLLWCVVQDFILLEDREASPPCCIDLVIVTPGSELDKDAEVMQPQPLVFCDALDHRRKRVTPECNPGSGSKGEAGL